tara:strand:+ start:2760 stop:3098 length:339 start_codon:yes stop_codon:yes gene_type:complete
VAELLFKLSNVPVDEILQVRQLLDEHNIHYYETDSGSFGVGVSAIWLPDSQQLEQAKALLAQYQLERSSNALEEKVERNLWHSFIQAPLRFVCAFAVVGAILYISIAPFFIG